MADHQAPDPTERDDIPPRRAAQPATPPAGRAARDPDEGPAPDGGSGLDAEDAAAEEEIGGGD